MRLFGEVLVLCFLYGVAEIVTRLFSLSVPAVLVGMVMLFLFLVTGVIKAEYFDTSTRFFYRHMMLFLVPSIVGILKYWGILWQEGWTLLLIIIASTTFVLVTTAWGAMIFKGGGKRNADR
jgi:holin-like protein